MSLTITTHFSLPIVAVPDVDESAAVSSLTLCTSVTAVVEADDICAPEIYTASALAVTEELAVVVPLG